MLRSTTSYFSLVYNCSDNTRLSQPFIRFSFRYNKIFKNKKKNRLRSFMVEKFATSFKLFTLYETVDINRIWNKD